MDVINDLVNQSTNLIANGGPIIGFLLVFIECFIPELPLGVLVALNINAFGFLFGLIISWCATCLGCILCYLIFYKLSNKFIYKILGQKTKNKIEQAINKFQNIKLSTLVLIITLPFTPSFLINILAGVSSMTKEKFIVAILIGKIFMLTFWGYIGKSLLESMTDIKAIIFIFIILTLAYIISKFISKKMHID